MCFCGLFSLISPESQISLAISDFPMPRPQTPLHLPTHTTITAFSVRDACAATFPFVKPLLKLQDSNFFKHLPNQVAYSLTVIVPSILLKFRGIKFRRSSSLRWTPQALSPATFFPLTVAQLVFVHSTIHCSMFSPDLQS
jgi:hypothetical protein